MKSSRRSFSNTTSTGISHLTTLVRVDVDKVKTSCGPSPKFAMAKDMGLDLICGIEVHVRSKE
jgi:hypothetical protein